MPKTTCVHDHRTIAAMRWVPISFGIAAVSLLMLPDGLGYDPWSWMIWGHELDHGSLVTAGAASAIKPLPVLVDVLLAPFGSTAADLWLVCARAGVLLSIVLVYHLAKELGGRAAGVTAAVGWFTARQVAGYLALDGMSEPLCAALVLGAVDAHLCNRRRLAVALGALGALIRIELWPFVAGYAAMTLWRENPHSKARAVPVVALLATVPAAWLVPDALSSGNLLRSAVRATHESQGGPLATSHPALSTIVEAGGMLVWPLVAVFVADTAMTTVLWVKRRQLRATFWLTCAAWAWIGLEALMVALRVAAGAPRFLLPGVALAAVVAGCAWADLLRRLPSLLPRAKPALVLAVAWLALSGASVVGVAKWVRDERGSWASGANVQQLADQLPTTVKRLGGRDAVVGCGTIAAAPLQVPAVAWALDVPLGDVGIRPSARGVVFATDGQPTVPAGYARDYRKVGTVGPPAARWTELTTCWPDQK
jgi:hypothetical protein